MGQPPPPLQSLHTNNPLHSATLVTPFLPQGFHPNSKCPLNLLCWKHAHQSLKIYRNCNSTSTTKSLMPQAYEVHSASHCHLILCSKSENCLVDSQNIKTHDPSKKLNHQLFGPFLIKSDLMISTQSVPHSLMPSFQSSMLHCSTH